MIIKIQQILELVQGKTSFGALSSYLLDKEVIWTRKKILKYQALRNTRNALHRKMKKKLKIK